MDGTNAQCCSDKGVAHALHCAWCMRKDMVYYSDTHGAKHATKAIMPQSASLTQHMNIVHLKTEVSHSTQQDPLQNTPPNPQCEN